MLHNIVTGRRRVEAKQPQDGDYAWQQLVREQDYENSLSAASKNWEQIRCMLEIESLNRSQCTQEHRYLDREMGEEWSLYSFVSIF